MARPQKFTPEDVMARNIDMSGQSIKKQHTVAQCADALHKSAGNVTAAARGLGIARTSYWEMVEDLGFEN